MLQRIFARKTPVISTWKCSCEELATLRFYHAGSCSPALWAGQKQHKINMARFCMQSCSIVGQLLANTYQLPFPWRFARIFLARLLWQRPRNNAPKSVCAPLLGNENSAQDFSGRSLWKSLRAVDVRAFGSWMSGPNCLFFFFQDFHCPDRSFGPGYPSE